VHPIHTNPFTRRTTPRHSIVKNVTARRLVCRRVWISVARSALAVPGGWGRRPDILTAAIRCDCSPLRWSNALHSPFPSRVETRKAGRDIALDIRDEGYLRYRSRHRRRHGAALSEQAARYRTAW